MSEALVLSCALGTTRGMFDGQLPALEPRFRLLFHEHRGRESVEALAGDVLALLDRAGIERASFCGVSLGGAVGMCLAATAPGRVERLLLSCTAARFGPPEQWRERAALVRAEGTGPLLDATMGRWFTPRAAPEVVGRFRRMLAAAPHEDYAACCEALAGWDFRGRLGEIEAPTLVLAGADDPSTPPAQAEELAAGIPGARLVVLQEAAHLANVERADAWNAAALEHLAGRVAA